MKTPLPISPTFEFLPNEMNDRVAPSVHFGNLS
jgi:hypothetical protein